MTSRKLRRVLDWEPSRGVSAAVDSIMAHRTELKAYDQVNIEWMKALEHGQKVTQNTEEYLQSEHPIPALRTPHQ
jgi:hypothetical protein